MQYKIGTVFSGIDEIQRGKENACVRSSACRKARQFMPGRFSIFRGRIAQNEFEKCPAAGFVIGREGLIGEGARHRDSGIIRRSGGGCPNAVVGLCMDGHPLSDQHFGQITFFGFIHRLIGALFGQQRIQSVVACGCEREAQGEKQRKRQQDNG